VTSREDIRQAVRELTDGKGVPVVYDSIRQGHADGFAGMPADNAERW
jgi:NADPH:quinone reductase-like Zn-dependent oxidoreductase